MNCEKCPLKRDLESYMIFFRFMKMDKVKDFDAWKRFNELYEFLKSNEINDKKK